MTAFLFIPATLGGSRARRVDLGNIASLFAEAEEAPPHGGGTRALLRAGAAVLLLLLAIGDTFLVMRPAALESGAAPAVAAARART